MAYDGSQIKQARQRARLTQKQLAEMIDGSERAVSRWEKEGVPDGAHHLGALERVLKLGPAAELRAEPAQTPADRTDPRALSDGTLFALLNQLTAEVQRRYYQAIVSPRNMSDGSDGPYAGRHAPFPHHLADPQGDERSQSGG